MMAENLGHSHKTTGDSLVQLEFAKVVDLVIGKTQTPYGRALAAALTPLDERSQIEEALREAAEAGQLLQKDGPLPLGSSIDLLPYLARLQTEGMSLEAEVLRDVQAALEAAAVCRQKLLNSEVCPSLQLFARQLTSFPELSAEIRRSIGPRAEILDSASFELRPVLGSTPSCWVASVALTRYQLAVFVLLCVIEG